MQIRGRYVNRKENRDRWRTSSHLGFCMVSAVISTSASTSPAEKVQEKREMKRRKRGIEKGNRKGEQRINDNYEKDENGKIGGSKLSDVKLADKTE